MKISRKQRLLLNKSGGTIWKDNKKTVGVEGGPIANADSDYWNILNYI